MSKYLLNLFLSLLLFLSIGCKKDKKEAEDIWEVVVDESLNKNSFRDVKFQNENMGFALCLKSEGSVGSHTLWVTTNAGKSWQPQSFFLEENFITQISVTDNSIFGAGNQLFFSENYGMNWQNIYPSSPYTAIGSVFFSSRNTGFIASQAILKTEDHGETWSEVFMIPYMSIINKLSFTDQGVAYATGGSTFDNANFGFIAKSTNGGNSWSLLETNFANITNSFFISSTRGSIFTFNNQLYETIDGGLSWKLINDKIAEKYPKVYFISKNEGYIGGGTGIFHTENGGRDWKKEYSVNNDIITGLFVSGDAAVAVTNNGLILRKQL